MNLLTPFRERLWHMFSPGNSSPVPVSPKPPSPRTDPLHKVRNAGIEKSHTRRKTLSPTVKRLRKLKLEDRASSNEEEEHDLDSSHESESESHEDIEPRRKRLKRSTDHDQDDDYEPEEVEQEPTADITQEEKDEFGIGITIEPVAHATLEDPDYEGWTQDELDLHNKLNDRGVVPLLFSGWKLDFPTIPEALFTEDRDEAYIKSERGSEFRGMRALANLLQAGVRMRDRGGIAHRNPAPILARIIESYIKWSLDDVGLDYKALTPLISVMTAPRTEAIQKTVTRMTAELQRLSASWRAFWAEAHMQTLNGQSDQREGHEVLTNGAGTKRKRENESESEGASSELEIPADQESEGPPTLYGIVIARNIMAFVTYDSRQEDSNVRNLALFNWRDPGQDVWNALAVALMIIQAREVLLWLGADKIAMRVRPGSSGDDPDA